jgi:hydroxymethylcytosylglucuronate/cytosylglucuronate synthase
MPDSSGSVPPRLLVGAGEFGWGSVGKLRLVLDELSEVAPVVVGSRLGRGLLHAHGMTEFRDEPRNREEAADLLSSTGASAALVVGKPDLAELLVGAECPVVFLDSLPFLWTERDPVPFDVDTYCAQRCVPEPAWPVLREIRRLVWVDSVVPKARTASARDGVTINLGGLHSQFSGDTGFAYAATILPAAIDAVMAEGLRIRAVCGNLSADQVAWIRQRLGPGAADVRVGLLSPVEFEAELAATAVLISSPGSTTLLQADHCGTPVITLPPQNLSQLLNARWFADGDGSATVDWPRSVLDPDVLETHRLGGEEQAVGYLYAAIASAAQDAAIVGELQSALRKALVATGGPPSRRRLLERLGDAGAVQVADEVRRLIARGRTPRNGRKVYVGGPFQAVLDGDRLRIDARYQALYEELIDAFEQRGWQVFNAHRREAWGGQMLDAPTSTRTDFTDIADCDLFVATPGARPASPGTHIEIGWASALGKRIVLLLQAGESYAALVNGLPTVADVTFVPFRFGTPVADAVAGALDA